MAENRAGLIYWYTMGSLRRDLLDRTLNNEPLLPALTELARESVFFSEALSASGSSFLSAAAMLTGRWPSRLGIKDCPVRIQGQGMYQACGLDSGVPTLPARLAGQGFSTFSHPDSLTPSPGDGLEAGFTHPGALPERIEPGQGIFIWHQAKGCRLPLEPTGMALAALGLEDRDLKAEDPEIQKKLYQAAAFDADRALARALGELGEAGLWDQSLIVVTAGQGLELFEHGGLGAPSGLYRENLAVPLFIKFPADHPLAEYHGQRVEGRVRLIDLAPTLAELGTGEEPPDIDGLSLLPLIGGGEESPRDLIAFQSALAPGAGEPLLHESLAVITGSFKALGGYRAGESRSEDGEVRPPGSEIRELYDLAQDPAESHNLADEQRDLFQEMMVEAASVAAPLSGSLPDRPSGADEEEKEALVEKLRSLGYI